MNILIPAGIFPPDVGGPANFVPRIAQWLVRGGHNVSVVCWSDETTYEDSQFDFKVHRILRRGSRLKRLVETVFYLYRFGRSADIIFANGLDLETRVAATLLKKKAIHKVVGDRAWEIARVRQWYKGTIDEFQKNPKSIKLRCLGKLRDVSLARAAAIITPSCYLANIVGGWHISSGTIQVIYNSVRRGMSGKSIELPPFQGKTLVTICRLVAWKGVDGLINTLPFIPEARLIVAGDGPELVRLKEQACRQNLAERVIFLGKITKSQVTTLLEQSDIFVLNSSYEGLPHTVLEAMAANVPVIATDVGGVGEAVIHNETGLLVPYDDGQALLEAIRQLLNSQTTRQHIVKNARLRLQQFDEGNCFQAYENLIKRVLRDSTRAL